MLLRQLVARVPFLFPNLRRRFLFISRLLEEWIVIGILQLFVPFEYNFLSAFDIQAN